MKHRIPKPIRIPRIVANQVDAAMKPKTEEALLFELHTGLLAISNGAMNENNFQRISSIVNLIMVALSGKIVDRSVEAAIDGCARTLQEIDARFEKQGSWALNDFQVASIRAGILKIEESLPLLSMDDIRAAQIVLEGMK